MAGTAAGSGSAIASGLPSTATVAMTASTDSPWVAGNPALAPAIPAGTHPRQRRQTLPSVSHQSMSSVEVSRVRASPSFQRTQIHSFDSHADRMPSDSIAAGSRLPSANSDPKRSNTACASAGTSMPSGDDDSRPSSTAITSSPAPRQRRQAADERSIDDGVSTIRARAASMSTFPVVCAGTILPLPCACTHSSASPLNISKSILS